MEFHTQIRHTFKLGHSLTSLCHRLLKRILILLKNSTKLVTNLLMHVSENNITGKQLCDMLRILTSEILILDIEELFVQV